MCLRYLSKVVAPTRCGLPRASVVLRKLHAPTIVRVVRCPTNSTCCLRLCLGGGFYNKIRNNLHNSAFRIAANGAKTVDKEQKEVYNQTILNKENRTMAHKITDECIACGGCQSVCPCEAISEGDGKFEINPDLCVDCGACAAQCPVGAIEEA